ncbi:MAG TPA: hypothetical protein VJ546_03505 [Bacillales bacterium]|nr:hypothetical protein [Bacillales bacterium]
MAFIHAKVKIVGKRPLLFNNFTLDSIPLERVKKTGVAGNNPDEWKTSYSATKDGQLYLDPSQVFGNIREGARYTKNGGRSTFQPTIASTLQILDNQILLNQFLTDINAITKDSTQPVYIDARSVFMPRTRARNIRYRLAVNVGWEASFEIAWEETLINERQMESICRDAGIYAGLGDGRKIGFGRYDLSSFEVSDYSA